MKGITGQSSAAKKRGRATRSTHTKDAVEDRSSGDTTLEVINLRSRLVDVKRPNDDHPRSRREVARWDGDLGADVLIDGIDVVLQLRRDGDDGRLASDGRVDKLADLLHLLPGCLLSDEVDLVLKNDDVLLAHELERGQMLRSLGLRARLVGGDEEEGTVHDGGSRKHGGHKNARGKHVRKEMHTCLHERA